MDDQLVEFSSDQIQFSFLLDGKEYVVYSLRKNPVEGDDLFFGRIEYLDEGIPFVMNISDEEYDKVNEEFQSYLALADEDEE